MGSRASVSDSSLEEIFRRRGGDGCREEKARGQSDRLELEHAFWDLITSLDWLGCNWMCSCMGNLSGKTRKREALYIIFLALRASPRLYGRAMSALR